MQSAPTPQGHQVKARQLWRSQEVPRVPDGDFTVLKGFKGVQASSGEWQNIPLNQGGV